MKRALPIALFALLLTGCATSPGASACGDAALIVAEASKLAELGTGMSGAGSTQTDITDRFKSSGDELNKIADNATRTDEADVIHAAGDALHNFGVTGGRVLTGGSTDALDAASNELDLALYDLAAVCD